MSIVAATSCRYLYWQRSSLEYLFAKETYLGTVVTTLIAKDIATKLYAMNNKASLMPQIKLTEYTSHFFKLNKFTLSDRDGSRLSFRHKTSKHIRVVWRQKEKPFKKAQTYHFCRKAGDI